MCSTSIVYAVHVRQCAALKNFSSNGLSLLARARSETYADKLHFNHYTSIIVSPYANLPCTDVPPRWSDSSRSSPKPKPDALSRWLWSIRSSPRRTICDGPTGKSLKGSFMSFAKPFAGGKACGRGEGLRLYKYSNDSEWIA